MKKISTVLLASAMIHSIDADTIRLGTSEGSRSSNLLINGAFSSNCPDISCIYKSANSNSVRGWTPEPELEIGSGYLFSDEFTFSSTSPNQQVIELAGNQNTCISQVVTDLNPGQYQFSFDYAARKCSELNNSKLTVEVNGNKSDPIVPRDYHFATQTSSFTLADNQTTATVRLCGVGEPDNGLGAIIKSSSLLKTSSEVNGVAYLYSN